MTLVMLQSYYVPESFTPASIPDITLWYDVSTQTGLSNGQIIPTLTDNGPLGYDVFQHC